MLLQYSFKLDGERFKFSKSRTGITKGFQNKQAIAPSSRSVKGWFLRELKLKSYSNSLLFISLFSHLENTEFSVKKLTFNHKKC